METKGENPNSLATKAGIPRVTLLRKLAASSPFNVDELEAISGVLEVPASELVRTDAA